MDKNIKIKKKLVLAFAGQLFPALVGIGAFMLLVRFANPGVLGQYIIYMAAVVLFEMIKSGGFQSAYIMLVANADNLKEKQIIGSTYWLAGMISLSISTVLLLLFISGVFLQQPEIQIFCGWYALLGIITIPLHLAEATAVARQDLKFLLWLRLAQSTSTLFIALYAFFFMGSLVIFATIHLVFTCLILIVILILGKTDPLLIKFKTYDHIRALVKLIKYTMASLATTNLLKSADTFIIGSTMGPLAVAKYAIPLKLTELFEIPLRILTTTAFPELSAKFNKRDFIGFKSSLVQYLSLCYLLYIPALVGAFIFAPYLILFIGGNQYADTSTVFRVFILFGFFLPANRLTGISLDALQKPQQNFKKLLIMAVLNIVGDVVAIHYSHSLNWVAFASVVNAAFGALAGWWMLDATGILGKENILKTMYRYSNSFIKQCLTT